MAVQARLPAPLPTVRTLLSAGAPSAASVAYARASIAAMPSSRPWKKIASSAGRGETRGSSLGSAIGKRSPAAGRG